MCKLNLLYINILLGLYFSEAIQKEIQDVKREYHKNKLKKEENEIEEANQEAEKNQAYQEYKIEYTKYKDKTAALPKKGAGREQFTLELLAKFKQRLQQAKEVEQQNALKATEEKEEDGEKWLSHELHFKDDAPVLAKDANTKDDDWFEIYDPRNPLNKRRRGESTKTSKQTNS